ncbi:MAG: prephenate dehydratase domain-containing protein [Polyangiaceae bacterium]
MASREKLEELVRRLDEVDREILRTIERRARVVEDMVGVRSKLGGGAAEPGRIAPILDANRLRTLESAVTPPFPASAVRPIFAEIDAACRVYEVAPKVACVGAEGGLPWVAAALHFGQRAQLLRAETAEKALEEVARAQADFAVVTIETVRDGLAFATIQSIASQDLKLVGEREIAHTLMLVSRTGNQADVERIYTTSLHHALCEAYLASAYPKATVLHVRSALMAAELAGEHHGAAAIVPHGLALPIEMAVLAENVCDEGELRIRYAIVSRLPMTRTGNDATALLFSAHDKPGALLEVLQVFKDKNCNLRRIQSHAVPGEGWEYVFYVEVSGHVTDRPLVSALEGVKQRARMLKILGSFPLDVADPVPSSNGLR